MLDLLVFRAYFVIKRETNKPIVMLRDMNSTDAGDSSLLNIVNTFLTTHLNFCQRLSESRVNRCTERSRSSLSTLNLETDESVLFTVTCSDALMSHVFRSSSAGLFSTSRLAE